MPAVDLHDATPVPPPLELREQLRIARLGRGDQGGVERPVGTDRARLMLAREIAGEPRHQRLGLFGIRVQHANDLLHGDRVMMRMPAIEIGDHRHAGVTDLGLAGEFGLGHVGHADHRIALRLVGQALGSEENCGPSMQT